MLTTIESPDRQPAADGLLCREELAPGAVDTPETDTVEDTGADTGKSLLCRQCRAVITSRRYAVAINGNHLHTFFNPAGIIYEIRCFRQAQGCDIHGRPTEEFSWFAGYAWRYALCSACRVHLGWMFESAEHIFFGLIDSRLIDG